MTDPKYAAFTALDPFFDIVQQGLAGLVDGDHYFDTIADDAEFEFRYHFPGWPETVRGRDALMALYAGYGNNIVLHGADELVVHRSQDPRVVIIEYDVHGKIVATGSSYDNRFISVVTIEGRKIVQWRDYMDSLAAMTALSQVLLTVAAYVRQSKKKVSVLWRLENAAAVKGDAVPAVRVAHPNRCPPILDGRFLSFRRKVSGICQVKNGSIPVNPCREIGEVLFQ